MMDTTVDALKTLYVALGGTAAELPAVTDADNGKVLKVASGKWSVGTDATT